MPIVRGPSVCRLKAEQEARTRRAPAHIVERITNRVFYEAMEQKQRVNEMALKAKEDEIRAQMAPEFASLTDDDEAAERDEFGFNADWYEKRIESVKARSSLEVGLLAGHALLGQGSPTLLRLASSEHQVCLGPSAPQRNLFLTG